jgi:F-type H+-transporting ATPase subunit alpha
MTFFPIVQTLEGDVTGYIPSNLISMTDGQIYLSSALFSEGFKPAVDFSLSVSTIGSRVQEPVLKELSEELRSAYVEYRQILPLAKLKAGFSKAVEAKIRKGEIISELLIQDKNAPFTIAEMIVLFYALKNHFLDNLSDERLKEFKEKIYGFIIETNPDLMKRIDKEKKLTEANIEQLNASLEAFFKKHIAQEQVRAAEEAQKKIHQRKTARHTRKQKDK